MVKGLKSSMKHAEASLCRRYGEGDRRVRAAGSWVSQARQPIIRLCADRRRVAVSRAGLTGQAHTSQG